jgi:serine/threonine protein kinase
LNNYQGSIDVNFLREIAYYKLFKDDYDGVVKCFGISQDPQARNFLMVIDYIRKGNLRQYLNNKKLGFYNKMKQLRAITKGLNSIHRQDLIHRDLHPGNVLISNNDICLITDFGLSRLIDEEDKRGMIYGVLPYVAPEVLQSKSYTQASDIYSFGIVAYELLSDNPPYHDYPHDEPLAVWICQGLRPNLNNIAAPQLLKDLIKRC